MEIVKAEILFSRKCNLKCKHCSMVTGEENVLSIAEWFTAMDALKKMGCKFAAFYGAEPMLEFHKLKNVVGYSEKMGIHTTVITSGVGIPNFRSKLVELWQYGAKSLSMSYDIVPYDKSSNSKLTNTIDDLLFFKKLEGIRDVAAISVLNASNYHLLPTHITRMSDLGIWTFFDLIHFDRGMPGTKCKGQPDKLAFEERHMESLLNMLDLVSSMKKNGLLVHNSRPFVDTIQENWSKGRIYSWCCADYPQFPSWVTIDCDGSIYPCDDFHIDYHPAPKIHHWHPPKYMKEYFEGIRAKIFEHGCECCWNTHIDAHAVKRNVIPITDYIHGDLNGKS